MKTLPKTIETRLIQKDFKGARYSSNDDCPIARSLKRMFPALSHTIKVGCTTVFIGNSQYEIQDAFNGVDVIQAKIEQKKPRVMVVEIKKVWP